ncbi:hypothetical protein K2X30_15730 [bacterium]|jgi:hypothetical protein|nr:hypothetical protein [bacterium]
MSQANFRDILGAHLREDKRVTYAPIAKRQFFTSPMYDVYLYVYPGLPHEPPSRTDLVTALIVYKDEMIRIMVKLLAVDIQGSRDDYLDGYISKLQFEGKSPLHMVRDAKVWCSVPLTQRDVTALLSAGIDVHKHS